MWCSGVYTFLLLPRIFTDLLLSHFRQKRPLLENPQLKRVENQKE